MQRTSSHPELKRWNLPMDIAAASKRSFLLMTCAEEYPLNELDTDTYNVVGKLIDALRAVFHPTLESYGHAVKERRGVLPEPMDVFDSWEKYKTSAEKAYDDFLRPVNEAIETLKATHSNWTSGPPTVDTRSQSSPPALRLRRRWSLLVIGLGRKLTSSAPVEHAYVSSSSKRPRSRSRMGPRLGGRRRWCWGSDARSRLLRRPRVQHSESDSLSKPG